MTLTFKHKLYGVLFAIALILFLFMYIPRAYRGSVTVLIKEKERVTYEEEGITKSKYLVYSEEEVYENVDDWFYLKFSSSDIYGQLNSGDTYKVWLSGWRINILSSYRNIISVEKVVDPAPAKEGS